MPFWDLSTNSIYYKNSSMVAVRFKLNAQQGEKSCRKTADSEDTETKDEFVHYSTLATTISGI
jgi:hypothetical protein